MKRMLVIASSKSGRIRRKHVEFKAAKHTIVAGNLCHKADPLKIIGRITRCYSEPYVEKIKSRRSVGVH